MTIEMVEYREIVHQYCDGRIKRSIVHQDYRDIEKQRSSLNIVLSRISWNEFRP